MHRITRNEYLSFLHYYNQRNILQQHIKLTLHQCLLRLLKSLFCQYSRPVTAHIFIGLSSATTHYFDLLSRAVKPSGSTISVFPLKQSFTSTIRLQSSLLSYIGQPFFVLLVSFYYSLRADDLDLPFAIKISALASYISLRRSLPIDSSITYHIISPLADRQLIASHILFWNNQHRNTFLYDFGTSSEMLLHFQTHMTNFQVSSDHKPSLSSSSFVLGVPVIRTKIKLSPVTTVVVLDWGLTKFYSRSDFSQDLSRLNTVVSLLSKKHNTRLRLLIKPRYSTVVDHFTQLSYPFSFLSSRLSLTDVIAEYGACSIFLHHGSTSMYELSCNQCRQINLSRLFITLGPHSIPRPTTSIGYLPSSLSELEYIELNELNSRMLTDESGVSYDLECQIQLLQSLCT